MEASCPEIEVFQILTQDRSTSTQHDYVQRVKDFAVFLGRSPDKASKEDVRRFQLHLQMVGRILRLRSDGREVWQWTQIGLRARTHGPKRRRGRLVVHLNRQTTGWRIVHPRVTPEVCDPDLASAKARALPIALAALPLHPATRRANAIANRLPSSSHLLTLQALPPEQRKTAPVEVLDAARFSIPVNLLGGHRFANAPRLDWDTRKTIVAEELEISLSDAGADWWRAEAMPVSAVCDLKKWASCSDLRFGRHCQRPRRGSEGRSQTLPGSRRRSHARPCQT